MHIVGDARAAKRDVVIPAELTTAQWKLFQFEFAEKINRPYIPNPNTLAAAEARDGTVRVCGIIRVFPKGVNAPPNNIPYFGKIDGTRMTEFQLGGSVAEMSDTMRACREAGVPLSSISSAIIPSVETEPIFLTESLRRDTEDIVTGELKIPETAYFSKLSAVREPDGARYTCGFVDAHKRDGTDTGKIPFLVSFSNSGVIRITLAELTEDILVVMLICEAYGLEL